MNPMRMALLAMSRSRWLGERATRHRFVRRAVRRFMPGETMEAAFDASQDLHAAGMVTVLTLLGENVGEASEAQDVTRHYLAVLDRARSTGLDIQISVKPTQLGLDLDHELCHGNLAELVEAAARTQNMVWIDMESSPYVEPTLELYRRLRAQRPNVGVCLQAYLRRTADDLDALLPLQPAIRLVKGAYLEPGEIAFPTRREVDESYLVLAERLLDALRRDSGTRVGIATHDRRLIDRINAGGAARGLSRQAYEWQMLYGIQRDEQRRLVREGHRVRVLVSYGSAWFAWYMRRLAERPANLLFVARNLFAR